MDRHGRQQRTAGTSIGAGSKATQVQIERLNRFSIISRLCVVWPRIVASDLDEIVFYAVRFNVPLGSLCALQSDRYRVLKLA